MAIGAELLLKGELTELPKQLRVAFFPVSERLLRNLKGLCAPLRTDARSSGAELLARVSPMLAAAELLLGFSPAVAQVPSVWNLAKPERHPFGNWLQSVMDLLHVSSPSALVHKTDAAITLDSAMRYARGEMLTLDAARRLTNGIPNAAAFVTAIPAARAMGLAIEFLVAADRGGTLLGDERARKIVLARVRNMYLDVQVAIMRITRRREKAMLAVLDGSYFVDTGPDWSTVTLADLDRIIPQRSLAPA